MYYIIALIVFIADQITKQLIKMNMEIGDAHPVWGNFFAITSHRNEGAAFGILQGQRVFFLIITIIFVIGIFYFLRKMIALGNKLLPLALSLMLGGAVGNFLDRAIHGKVVDFLQFNFQFSVFGLDVDYIFPIFNVADSGVVVGTILVLFDTLLSWRRESKVAQLASVNGKDTNNDSA